MCGEQCKFENEVDGQHSLYEKRIASASADGTVQIWDAFIDRTDFIYKGHSGIVWSVS